MTMAQLDAEGLPRVLMRLAAARHHLLAFRVAAAVGLDASQVGRRLILFQVPESLWGGTFGCQPCCFEPSFGALL